MEDADKELALDGFSFASRCQSQGRVCDAVRSAETSGGRLVQHGKRVGGEEVLGSAGPCDADADVVCGVVGGQGADSDPVVEPGVERAIAPGTESVVEVG